jgi:hypothetical protein
LKGLAVDLWSDGASETMWLVADERDAMKLGEQRGSVYAASEVCEIIRIKAPALVREIHL